MGGMRTQAVIREATPDDARAIATVHVSSWRTTYRGLLSDRYLDSLDVDDHEGRWLRLLASGAGDTFVAQEGSEVVGFASCGRERDQDPIYLGELFAIYLLQDHQRRGLGRRLVSVAAERLIELEYRSMLVWVLAANPARAFYEALGGAFVRSRQMEIAGETKEEAGYGWLDAAVLL
jgi:ribosomal protein S18 acetylase RimI-like enzyme